MSYKTPWIQQFNTGGEKSYHQIPDFFFFTLLNIYSKVTHV